ncbi:hypothetical protein ACQY0O_006815 [Thecaphora frezii]
MAGNAEASTSAAATTTAPAPTEPPSNSFGSEDFIAFDFNDDTFGDGCDDDSSHQPASLGSGTKGKGTTNTTNNRDLPPSSSALRQSAGKKRKIDDRDDDGKTKQERIQERREARSRYTPWSADVDWSRCRNGAEMLHREIMAFDSWLAPTYAEHETRVMVIELISRAIKGRWRDAQVYSFGSQETKLYLPQGDIDLVVVSDTMEYQRRETVLRAMAATLRQHNLATEVQVIARAKVPIVKFVCTYAKLRVDISVNQTNGLSAAKYVNSWLRKCPSMRPLVMAVKHLLVQRGMSEVFSGGLGSYSVIIMVISFLQLHPKVQRGEIDPARNLGVLFLEFLELYGKNFGYDTCGISIRGKGGYFSKARRGWKDERKPFMLCIEDPHDPTNDISRGSYGILNIRAVFSGAFDIVTAAICQNGSGAAERSANASKKPKHKTFDADSDDEDAIARSLLLEEARSATNTNDKDPNSLLGTIVGVSKAMMKQREEMEELYQSGSLQNRLGRPPPLPSPPPAERYLRVQPAALAAPPPENVSRGRKGKAQHEKGPQPPPGPSPKKIKGQAKKLAQTVSDRRGGASDPISILSSPDRELEPATLSIRGAAERRKQNSRAAAISVDSRSSSPEIVDEAELAASQGFSFSSGSHPSQDRVESLMGIARDAAVHVHPNGVIEILSGSDEEVSRYNAGRSKRQKTKHSDSPHPAPGGRKARRRSLAPSAAEFQDLSTSAPSTFVTDSSDDAASVGDAGEEDLILNTTSTTATEGDGEPTGRRRSQRIRNQSSSTNASQRSTPSASGAQQATPPVSQPRTRAARKLTSAARREFWTAKGAVSPKEREGDEDESGSHGAWE